MANDTARQLAEQVLGLLNAHRLTRDIHVDEREVISRIRDAGSTLIRNRWYTMKNDGEITYMPFTYIATMEGVEVKEDNDGNNYSDLPVQVDDLPDESGIQSIEPEGKDVEVEREPMIPIPTMARQILKRLPAGVLEHRFGYEPRGNKVYYTERLGKTLLDENIDTVTMHVVTTGPEAVADDAPFPVSPHSRNELILNVLQMFGLSQQQAEDVVNDNMKTVT